MYACLIIIATLLYKDGVQKHLQTIQRSVYKSTDKIYKTYGVHLKQLNYDIFSA